MVSLWQTRGDTMKKKTLPTGEEPPKGYESVINLGTIDDSLHIDSVVISQLAKIERSEIEALRSKALAPINTLIGLVDDTLTFEQELDIIPAKSSTEKLLFRAYLGKELVGYALVIIGWPERGEWVIQHMIVNPEHRLKGIGSSIVNGIEEYAISSEVEANSIFAVPIQESGTLFWNNMGYSKATGSIRFELDNLNHDLTIFRKEI